MHGFWSGARRRVKDTYKVLAKVVGLFLVVWALNFGLCNCLFRLFWFCFLKLVIFGCREQLSPV